MLAGTAEVFTVTVPAWLLAALAFLGTGLGGAISFAVNQLLIKGAADRAAKKREKEDEQRRERYILQMDSRKATFSVPFSHAFQMGETAFQLSVPVNLPSFRFHPLNAGTNAG